MGRAGLSVLFVSHCDFTGNSALHVYSVAVELQRRGYSPAIAVPGNPRSVRDVGRPTFPVLTYRDVRRGRLGFRPDLVHAWTPRNRVRELTAELGLPYVVHLEDNEHALGRLADPAAAEAFLARAAGVTVVVGRLLEHKPEHVPGVVAWPGFDEAVLTPTRAREQVRAELGLQPGELAIVYTGNVHEWNLAEMRSLYLAVALLRRDGHPVVLVKTGWNSVPRSELVDLGPGLRDLGWVSRKRIPELLAAADVLVQPGRPGPWNDYRFPSKLPDFLASGRPVVLPRANIGLELEDGKEAIVMERGDATEIYASVLRLAVDRELGGRIGTAGRAFALRRLRWSGSVDTVEQLYRAIAPSAYGSGATVSR